MRHAASLASVPGAADDERAQGAAAQHLAVDDIQARIAGYIGGLAYDDLDADTRHAATIRAIDTLGALLGGFFGEPALVARDLAARTPSVDGATVIGTRMRTSTDLAAFANAATARYVEMNDVCTGSSGGHPSDVLMPMFGVAESGRASGRELMTAVVGAYKIFLRMSDAVSTPGFDCANFCCMGSAMGAGWLLDLSVDQLAEALSMRSCPTTRSTRRARVT